MKKEEKESREREERKREGLCFADIKSERE
jgi:hypothetical protein